jgi:hypothetical protein
MSATDIILFPLRVLLYGTPLLIFWWGWQERDRSMRIFYFACTAAIMTVIIGLALAATT